MCGISGIINFDNSKINKKEIIQMNDMISHRGQDGEGYFFNFDFGFGHKRLSIIDRSKNGIQPMVSANQRFIITYNGEIYNFKAIKNLLKKKYFFKSKTDTEVILNAFNHWGIKALDQFNGMFAFAIYDREEKEFYLVRDRYGIKPLYYEIEKNRILFASEIKSILSVRKKENTIDKKSLIEYFTFQNIISDNNLVSDIKILEPGTFIKICKNKKIKKTKYWDYDFSSSYIQKNEKDLEQEFIYLFQRAVERQLVSDIKIGSHLSSGLDSSAITYYANKKIKNLNTYTCGFNLNDISGIEVGYDESKTSRKLAKRMGTIHNEYVINSGDMEKSIKDLCNAIEEPRLGQSYPNYYLSKLVSKKNKVVLSGTGGDELFAGYPWRYFYKNNFDNSKDFYLNYYGYWQRLLPNKDLAKLFRPIKNTFSNFRTFDVFKTILLKNNQSPKNKIEYINSSLYFEAKTFLAGLLNIEDKINMSFGVENRVPFMDNDLVEFAMKCPLNMKLRNLNQNTRLNENLINKKERNFILTNDGKIILRNSFKKHLPKFIIEGNKKGFSGPDSTWFKKHSFNFINDTLFNKNTRIYEYLDKKEVQRIFDEHFSGQINRRLVIWSLVYFENFLKNFI